MTEAAIFVIFPFCMAYAMFSDLVSMTIANRVSVLLVVAFFVIALSTGMPAIDIATHFATGALCLAVTFGFFAAGWMGGGDAKLMAATMLWFGAAPLAMDYMLVAALFGGALTIGLLFARVMMLPVTGIDFVDRLLDTRTGIPYGIALGAAGLAVYPAAPFVELAVRGIA